SLRTRRASGALHTGITLGSLATRRTLRTGRPPSTRRASRTLRALCARVPLRPLPASRTLRTGGPLRARRASHTLCALRAGVALVALRPLATGRPDRPLQALRAGVALVALRPLATGRTDRPWGTRRPDAAGRTHLAGWPRRAPWWSHRSSGARVARRALQTRRSRSSGLPTGAWRAVRARLTILPILARGPDEPEVPDVDLSFLLGAEADAHEERAVLPLTQHPRLRVC